MTNNYNSQERHRVQVILNLLGMERHRPVQTLNDEQEKCITSMGLLKVLSNDFKPEHNKTISLQYWKLA